MIWSVIGWFFLGLFALVVLLFVLPLTFYVHFSGGQFSLRVRVLFVRLNIFPRKPSEPKPKKPKKKKPPKKDDKPKEKQDEQKPKDGMSSKVQRIKRIANAGICALKVFIRHLRIKDVRLVLPIHAADAADTAQRCGQVQGIIGGARAFLDSRLKVRYKQLEVLPDFVGQAKDELHFSCKISFCPGIIFPMAFAFFRKYRQGKRRYSKAVCKRALAQKKARAKKAQSTKSKQD